MMKGQRTSLRRRWILSDQRALEYKRTPTKIYPRTTTLPKNPQKSRMSDGTPYLCIYEVGKVATSVTSLIFRHLNGNISGYRVATTSYTVDSKRLKWQHSLTGFNKLATSAIAIAATKWVCRLEKPIACPKKNNYIVNETSFNAI